MIYADVRADFLGGIRTSKLTYSGEPLNETTIRNRRVVILVHGVKNTTHQIQEAYRQILNRAHAAYDVGVGFIWPGGVSPLGFPIASAFTVGASARALSRVIADVRVHKPASIDIDCHSLGCKVALEALDLLTGLPFELTVIDGLWMMAPAVPRSLSRYREAIAAKCKTQPHVFYSWKDVVLSGLFQLYPPFLPALGAWGESGPADRRVAIGHNCVAEVGANHTGYRHSNIVVQTRANEAQRRRREWQLNLGIAE